MGREELISSELKKEVEEIIESYHSHYQACIEKMVSEAVLFFLEESKSWINKKYFFTHFYFYFFLFLHFFLFTFFFIFTFFLFFTFFLHD